MDEDIDDTPPLDEAIASFLRALKQGDPDKLHQAMTETAASLRLVLERIAEQHGMSYDEMRVIAMMAVSAMAQDALPGTRRRLASYAALIDIEDHSPC